MNDIDQTLKALKSLDYKSPVRSRYVNKLTREDLIIFDEKIKEAAFLPDIHLHQEDKKCHSLALTILNYLYNEKEIMVWFNDCLQQFFSNLETVESKTIRPFKVYRKILGLNSLGIDLGFNELIDRKLFQKWVKDYKDQIPYPEELTNVYFKAIKNREPLIEAIAKTRDIFGQRSRHTWVRIIDSAVLPVIGKKDLKAYFTDMIEHFKSLRKVNPDIPVNIPDFSFFLIGSCNQLHLKNLLKYKDISTDLIKVYLEAMMPEFIKVKSVKREKLYRLLEFDDSQIQKWEAIYHQEKAKCSYQTSYNILEVTPDRLTSEELELLKNNLKILIEQFKQTRTVPTIKELFELAEKMDLKLFEKPVKDKAVINDMIRRELEELKYFYYQTRKENFNFESELWHCYHRVNERIQCSRLDFSSIKSPELKRELKIIFKRLFLNNLKLEKFTFLLSHCAELEESAGITTFKDITAPKLRTFYHHLIFERGLKPNTVSHYNTYLIQAFDILTEEVPSLGLINEARDIRFHNIQAHTEKTEIIPETVLKGINQHLDEVPEKVRLIFKLFMTTGWRFKEVVNLKPENFRKVKGYPDLIEVEATSIKTASSRQQAGYTLHPCDFIPVSLYNQLKEYLDKTRDEREFYHIDTCFYIFINGSPCTVPTEYFNRFINTIVQKHHLTDKEGKLWRFSSRQTRKKVAITLIEEGVPLNVVQQKLTHQSPRTTQTYYTESEEIKLAQVNEEYFREYIQTHLNPEIREKLSESELKQLYLSYEDSLKLENGVCRRPLCPRLSESGCTGCSKICTGEIYLNKWEELLESVRSVKAQLERLYKQNGIQPEVYTGFEEYQNLVQRENNLKSVVDEITEKVRK